jgi:hypothetical protein
MKLFVYLMGSNKIIKIYGEQIAKPLAHIYIYIHNLTNTFFILSASVFTVIEELPIVSISKQGLIAVHYDIKLLCNIEVNFHFMGQSHKRWRYCTNRSSTCWSRVSSAIQYIDILSQYFWCLKEKMDFGY